MLRPAALVIPLVALISASPGQDKKKSADKPAPKVLYSVPLAIKPGEKQKVTLRGKNLDAVKEVKASDGASVKFLAARKAGVPNNYPVERVGDTEVEIELDLPKGSKAVTLAVGDATFTPLVAADLPAVKEKEPNDGFDQAQALTIPCAVDCTIKGEKDADVFKFDGKKGERLRLEVVAARFGSPVDAMLTLYDADRRVIDSADDTDGTSDPSLNVTLPKDGTYFLTVIDAHDLGGSNFGYRLVVARAK